MAVLSQFKFPSPFARAYLHSPHLVQEALEAFNIGPFQADGELLCMCFLQPSDDPPTPDGVGSRPWEAFRRVLEDLGEHTDQTQSVIPSEQWKQWFLGLDEKVPFSPSDASDLERSLWLIMEKVTCGKPSYTFTPREYGWEHHDRAVWQSRHRPPPITQLQLASNYGTWNQLPNGPLKKNCGNIGQTDSLAIWPLMRWTSQRWQQ